MKLENHPSVIAYRQRNASAKPDRVAKAWVKQLALDAGADDVGVIDVNTDAVADQKAAILEAFPSARTLISFIIRMNPSQVQSRDRSLIDGEFIGVEKTALLVSRKMVRQLRKHGISAVTPAEGFPQNMSEWPGRMMTISHKPVAQAAGLGKIGHHRLLIHPEFGSHLCLGTIVMDTTLDGYDAPIDYNPCIHCNLCVSTCPTGAIAKDGSFNFFACLVHAYRDRLGGFLSWTEALVTSRTMEEYREKRDDSESLSVWQAMTYGGGYRCGYCMSVCPAGIDLIGAYLDRGKTYVREVVDPLKSRRENIYLLPDSDKAALARRFPNKTVKPA